MCVCVWGGDDHDGRGVDVAVVVTSQTGKQGVVCCAGGTKKAENEPAQHTIQGKPPPGAPGLSLTLLLTPLSLPLFFCCAPTHTHTHNPHNQPHTQHDPPTPIPV